MSERCDLWMDVFLAFTIVLLFLLYVMGIIVQLITVNVGCTGFFVILIVRLAALIFIISCLYLNDNLFWELVFLILLFIFSAIDSILVCSDHCGDPVVGLMAWAFLGMDIFMCLYFSVCTIVYYRSMMHQA